MQDPGLPLSFWMQSNEVLPQLIAIAMMDISVLLSFLLLSFFLPSLPLFQDSGEYDT